MNSVARYFNFSSLKTNYRRELLGGLATFLAVVYILSLQMNILGGTKSFVDPNLHMARGGIFLAIIIVAVVGCCVTGLFAKAPVALLPGIGVSAIFAFNLAPKIGFEGALIAVMLSTTLLVIVSVTKVRSFILAAIPKTLKTIIAVGIGFFLAYIGFRDIGFFKLPPKSGIPVASLSNWAEPENYSRVILGLCLIAFLLAFYVFKVKRSVLITLGIGLVISLLIGNLASNHVSKHFAQWNGWKYEDFKGLKTNLNQTFNQFSKSAIWHKSTLYLGILVITLVDFFDVSGTVYAFQNQIKTTDPECDLSLAMNTRKVLIADAVGGITNGFIGVSNSTIFLESGVGIADGARTGLSSLVIAGGFCLCLPLFPLFQLITSVLTGPILVFVGFLMMAQIKEVDWKQSENLIAGLFMILLATATFGITLPIAITFLVFSFTCCLQPKKRTKLNIGTIMLSLIFFVFIILNAWLQS